MRSANLNKTTTGIGAFLDLLAAAGVNHIFGNPGTTELPLNDALVQDSRFRYIFGLHEIPVLAMADGFAMARGSLSVANVHIGCGLGNSMGMLYNAWCEGTPLLLTAGQQDRRLAFDEPVLSADLVSVARPWTKWAVEVQRVADVPNAVRRAIQTALTPPTGPVFLSLPLDLQLESATFDLTPACVPDGRVRPPIGALKRAAEILAFARNPAIVAGSRVLEANATRELAALADLLAAPVFAENTTAHGRLPLATDHPLYAGILPYWSPDARQALAEFDVLFAVGINLLRLYIWCEPSRPIPEHIRIVQLDNNPREIGKNFPVEVGILGDPKCGLAELTEMLSPMLPHAAEREQRRERWTEKRKAEREALLAKIAEQRERRPLTPLAFMGALARVLPANAAVVEEAITTHKNVLERLGVLKDPTGHFAHRGWALGWGLGCAMGVKLAWPERPVVALLGDGAALYGIQGLWSAAHHNIPVTFIVCNNAQYKILKVCADMLPLPQMSQGNFLAMDLVQPQVDFVGVAKAFGVEATRVTDADQVSDLVQRALRSDQPQLFDVQIGGGPN